MREILFRGKSLEDGTWAEGLLYRYKDSTYIVYPGSGVFEKFIRVDPVTVGQWTDMTDKNGTKIFEGDIMRNAGNVVEFYGGSYCINGDCPLYYWTKTEVIGNIYDNPELLKGVKKKK